MKVSQREAIKLENQDLYKQGKVEYREERNRRWAATKSDARIEE